MLLTEVGYEINGSGGTVHGWFIGRIISNIIMINHMLILNFLKLVSFNLSIIFHGSYESGFGFLQIGIVPNESLNNQQPGIAGSGAPPRPSAFCGPGTQDP